MINIAKVTLALLILTATLQSVQADRFVVPSLSSCSTANTESGATDEETEDSEDDEEPDFE